MIKVGNGKDLEHQSTAAPERSYYNYKKHAMASAFGAS
jgi:hypothetical protein